MARPFLLRVWVLVQAGPPSWGEQAASNSAGVGQAAEGQGRKGHGRVPALARRKHFLGRQAAIVVNALALGGAVLAQLAGAAATDEL